MLALIFDANKGWGTRGFAKTDVLGPKLAKGDESMVIIKILYAGVCGSDKGIFYRTSFKDQILGSLELAGSKMRIIGHEMCGEIIDAGSKVRGLKKGDFVSAESHVVCNECFQCKNGQKNVCTNEKILGISYDGCFAEYMKIPAHIVWKTDAKKIRPEVAAVQEPFGNAVHAATKVPLKGKTIAIFGLGPIGLFLLLAARGLGAKKIIGLDPNPTARDMATRLGIDQIVDTTPQNVDVAFEMSGHNDALNGAIQSVRRGGDVILFGLKNADFVIKDYNRVVMKGITMHAVAGRQLWKTWDVTKELFENKKNGIQDKIYSVILQKGQGTILPIAEYTDERFEEMLGKNPKILISMQ